MTQQTATFIKCVRTKIPVSLRDGVGRLKKETIIKENRLYQPFRTQTSYRSNAQEQEKIETRNSIFLGESGTFGKSKNCLPKNYKSQDYSLLLWNGE